MKKGLFWFFLLLFLYLFLEVASFLGLQLLKQFRNIDYQPSPTYSLSEKHRSILKQMMEGKDSHVAFSPTLGWALKKGYQSEMNRINAAGFRSDREYSATPPDGKIRIATFGDSFTYGDEVANEDAWQEQMMKGKSDLEALNFGVGAYGLDQAFLRYRQDGIGYRPHMVMIGFMSENIARNVNVFRPFYFPNTASPLTKPRFKIEKDTLTLLENPVQELGRYEDLLSSPETFLPLIGNEDYWFRTKYKRGRFDILPSVRLYKVVRYELFTERLIKKGVYNDGSEAFRVTVKIFDSFVKKVLQERSLPVILLFPTKGDVMIHRGSEKKMYAPLVDYLKERNYPYLDLMDAFQGQGRYNKVDDLFLTYHYSPLGNRLVATHLLGRLRQADLFNLTTIKKQAAALKARGAGK